MAGISGINIRRPGLRLWSFLFRPGNRRLYWLRMERMPDKRNKYGTRTLYSFSACTIWEPRDLWLGVYWDASEFGSLVLFVCLLPCLPLRLHFKKSFGAGGVS